MTTNIFFDNFNSQAEQDLIESLVIESIRIYGHNMYYCPRTVIGKSDIWNEDARSEYNSAYFVELYIKNVEGFEGEGDFLSKFGIQIRDEITLTIARQVYDEEIGVNEQNNRPLEGDLIYIPMVGKLYQIKFVEHEPVFYQMGSLQMYDLKCELFEYSNEDLNTGIAEIDEIETKFSTDVKVGNNATLDANGNIVIDANTGQPVGISNTYTVDDYGDNPTYQDEANTLIDWDEKDPFSESGEY